MTNTNSIASTLSYELHEFAARLAGVEEILSGLAENPEGSGNTLHLLSTVVADLNDKICITADKVDDLKVQS